MVEKKELMDMEETGDKVNPQTCDGVIYDTRD